jgi:hypothetical protein
MILSMFHSENFLHTLHPTAHLLIILTRSASSTLPLAGDPSVDQRSRFICCCSVNAFLTHHADISSVLRSQDASLSGVEACVGLLFVIFSVKIKIKGK